MGQPEIPTVDVATVDSYRSPEGADIPAPDRPLLLDVREVAEYIHGHIPGTRNVPLGDLHAHVREMPSDRTIVCICRSGNRSATATALLLGAGFEAVNMRGGTLAWAESGRPLVDRQGRPGVVA